MGKLGSCICKQKRNRHDAFLSSAFRSGRIYGHGCLVWGLGRSFQCQLLGQRVADLRHSNHSAGPFSI